MRARRCHLSRSGYSRYSTSCSSSPAPPHLLPRPQRLLHSEAYIKYIEGLNKESRSMCNWDRQLNASSEVGVVAMSPCMSLAMSGSMSTIMSTSIASTLTSTTPTSPR